MKIKNFEQLATTIKRSDALSILDAGLAAVDTETVIRKTVFVQGDTLSVAGKEYALSTYERVRVIGVGKCSVAALQTLETVLGDLCADGIAIDVTTGVSQTGRISFLVGTHPLPSQANVEATGTLLSFLDSSTERDLIIAIISGGGSTLLAQPPESVSVQDEASVVTSLMNAGATIQEMNTVRKHLSSARGGGLASRAYPATVASLIFSDVPGDDISFISSGPTVLDTTTVSDAQALLTRYAIEGIGDVLMETPKEAKVFERVHNSVVVSNKVALDAMKQEAEAKGYAAKVVTTVLTGEARFVAQDIIRAVHEEKEKTVLLFGGETTVTSEKTHGTGGRNQEVALAALSGVSEDEVLVACASDGHDNTDVAGALCDSLIKKTAQQQDVSVDEHLTTHDSFPFFEKVSGHIITGNTGSNVSDLIIALK